MIAFYVFGAVLLLLVAVVAWSALRERAVLPEGGGESGPEGRLDAALEALRELEFDYRTEKMPEEDYRRLRLEYATEAVRAREELAAAGEDREGAHGPGVTCPSCGVEVVAGARFCPGCGARRET